MKKILLFTLLSTFGINAQTPTDYVSGFNTPSGIAFDASGNLYVADFYTYKVTKVTPTLTQSTFATVNGNVQQITFDSTGNLWLAGSGFIQGLEKITPAGVVTAYAGSNSPYGIAIDASGNVFYSELNGDIKKRTTAGVTSTFATGITQPNGLAFDKSGNLLVADKLDGVVKKITPTGVVSTLISGMSNPTNLVVAPNGDLYISTGSQNRIFRFPAGAADGEQELFIRFNTNYDTPAQMAIYNGALYVSTSSSTKKVIKITSPTLGLSEIKKPTNSLAIYPNPTTDFVHIENGSDVTIETIDLYDVSGRNVKSYKSSDIKDNVISVSNVVPGNYILKINNTSKKIIVK
ncbi:T9SS type A sorting domain-containing protein [Flavobacterium sp. KACC 22763]|uniref:T9SS type A sorting domain-containing protein n=1 Tax=Flavobacterium sp. KACC 22763 TaxID=3025668 RepID=UPI00236518ED|nr:T9SS type A sorting domain-containing protein [Flavobacterium sp. KACC 22763]WDF62671.1 T9SS type A sorting domain-containing protein [Flavobacterium sp. KACC 22763]